MNTKKLPLSFYFRDPVVVARDLLGKYLVRVNKDGISRGIIVETEAYGGKDDRASHVFGNKVTERNKIWFEKGGISYVYMIYGLYHCLGVITGKKSDPGAVLIRALEPIDGIDLMHKRRKVNPSIKNSLYKLCSGPSKICQAMDIDKGLYGQQLNGESLFLENSNEIITDKDIEITPRIGIDYSKEAAFYPWRFYIKNSNFISVKNYKISKHLHETNT